MSRALWTRAASVAHLPSVLSNAFPIEGDVEQSWMRPECDTVPGMSDWDCSNERSEYCFDLFLHMLEYVVVHEIAHHVRGHLALVNAQAGLFLIDEQKARATLPLDPADADEYLIQDLEFDADAQGLELSKAAMDGKHPFANEWESRDAAEWQFQLIFAQLMVAQVVDDPRKHDTEYTLDVFGVHFPSGASPYRCRIRAMNNLNSLVAALPEGSLSVAADDFNVNCNEAPTDSFGRLLRIGNWYASPLVRSGCDAPG